MEYTLEEIKKRMDIIEEYQNNGYVVPSEYVFDEKIIEILIKCNEEKREITKEEEKTLEFQEFAGEILNV
ncbi:MAG: hypothetical protein ACRCUP_03560 [Mycoplasmatales bacterium]